MVYHIRMYKFLCLKLLGWILKTSLKARLTFSNKFSFPAAPGLPPLTSAGLWPSCQAPGYFLLTERAGFMEAGLIPAALYKAVQAQTPRPWFYAQGLGNSTGWPLSFKNWDTHPPKSISSLGPLSPPNAARDAHCI